MSVVRRTSTDATIRRLTLAGAATLAIGLLLACLPNASAREGFFEGGISKGSPATLSYYATSVGLCVLLLVGLLVTVDAPGRRARLPGLVGASGQNPMFAYFVAHSTLPAIVTFSAFAGLNATIAADVRLDTLAAIVKTLLIAGLAWALTRRRIFWRA